MVRDGVDVAGVARVGEKVGVKGAPGRLDQVRLGTLAVGRCVQTLNVGSFEDEAQVLHLIHHVFIPDNGLRMTGKHHEIYLSDFRRVAPDKRRTILRQPVAELPAGAQSETRDEKRSEEHTSELQSLMRISYAVFCLKKKTHEIRQHIHSYD